MGVSTVFTSVGIRANTATPCSTRWYSNQQRISSRAKILLSWVGQIYTWNKGSDSEVGGPSNPLAADTHVRQFGSRNPVYTKRFNEQDAAEQLCFHANYTDGRHNPLPRGSVLKPTSATCARSTEAEVIWSRWTVSTSSVAIRLCVLKNIEAKMERQQMQ